MRKTPFFILCILITSAFCGVFFIPRPTAKKQVKSKQYIEVWHIDTFEGGTGSRPAFLNKVAKEFEKQTDVVVTVKTQTILSATEFFAKGIIPDAVSFGNGVELPYQQLVKLGEKPYEYAVPWCIGGYVAVSRKGEKPERAVLATQNNTLGRIALNASGIVGGLPVEEFSSSAAVYELYGDKHVMLIGTQRDLYRLENKGLDLDIKPLGVFNDLYQYYSVLSSDDKKAAAALTFSEYLLSEKVQKQLNGIGMHSLFYPAGQSPIDVFDGVKYEYATFPLIKNDSLKKLKGYAAEQPFNDEIKGLLLKF